ncbi:MAG: Endonuclease YhcR precursor [Smithella sp. PtaU1.Bin162]|nr:MAG: Endonuclease YhcR precursor [Smithella sp. PtaU1.Bin162]
MSIDIEKDDFQSLLSLLSQELEKGKLLHPKPGEDNRIFTYWNIGRILQDYYSRHSYSAEDVNSSYKAISGKLSIGIRTLYYTAQFYYSYPDLSALPKDLNWTNYKILLSIESPELRKDCEKLLATGNYSSREFFDLVKKKKDDLIQFIQSSLYYSQGIPYLYSVRHISGKASLDLGFYTYLDLFKDKLSGFSDKTPILSIKDNDDYSFQSEPGKSKFLYTYKAIVTDVVDGDTLKISVDLGFNIIRQETVRLFKIDAPELYTETGVKAKNFVIDRLSSVPYIAVKIYRKDKYARYLADVFYLPNPSNLNAILESGVFLNQELIDNGLAVKYYVG